MSRVKVSCVSYTNSIPFVFGLQNHDVSGDIELSLDSPAACAEKLKNGTVDIGLIPVAAIKDIPDAIQITNWCIGANGAVKSVTLLSEVPFEEVKTILLDFQSVTSNELTRLLAQHYWKINPEFKTSQRGFESQIKGNVAAVVIGDRSLLWQDKYSFVYDLAEEWKKFTGLPFVFARWVSNRKLDTGFLNKFNDALSFGIKNIDTVLANLKKDTDYNPQIESYLKLNLSYEFDDLKRKGMEFFLEKAGLNSPASVKVLY